MSMTALQLAEYTIRRATEKDKTITKIAKNTVLCAGLFFTCFEQVCF